jgi:thiamine biosynthesis lipoprotein
MGSMEQAREIMGMPVRITIVGGTQSDFDAVFNYFTEVDTRFSTYKPESEIMKINRGEIQPNEYSTDMREIFALAEQTKKETDGYFSIIRPDGSIDPSGIVKGWAIRNAATLIEQKGYKNYLVEVAGDMQSKGVDENNKVWTIGIRNPFNHAEIVKVVRLENQGIATSGTASRGQHIYNPHQPKQRIDDIVSITVIGPDAYEADRFATAAFAMGKEGILFIEKLAGFEGYQIDAKGIATLTTGFTRFLP